MITDRLAQLVFGLVKERENVVNGSAIGIFAEQLLQRDFSLGGLAWGNPVLKSGGDQLPRRIEQWFLHVGWDSRQGWGIERRDGRQRNDHLFASALETQSD